MDFEHFHFEKLVKHQMEISFRHMENRIGIRKQSGDGYV